MKPKMEFIFGIDNFEEFGKLSNRNIEELESHRK